MPRCWRCWRRLRYPAGGLNPAATIAIAYAWALPPAAGRTVRQWARRQLYAYVLALPWLTAADQLLTGGDAFGWGLPLAGAASGLLDCRPAA